jgi:hypothetical protein
VSENIPLSDREPAEGFHLSIPTAVASTVLSPNFTLTTENEHSS